MPDTPADELRAAAATLRHLAGVASAGPWKTAGAGDYGWLVTMPSSGLAIETEDSEQGAVDADYIAAMHPGVGKALADWLDFEADLIDRMPKSELQGRTQRALTIARTINQE